MYLRSYVTDSCGSLLKYFIAMGKETEMPHISLR